jgi:hypothetical protein
MHTTQWSTKNPGCFIIAYDQSGSMGKRFAHAHQDTTRKCEAVAVIINRFLENLIRVNTVFTPDGRSIVRPRAQVALIGYGNSKISPAFGEGFLNLPDLDSCPLEIVTVEEEELDDDGITTIRVPVDHPIWIKPVAEGNTPMCQALKHAWELAKHWAEQHLPSYPPVVVNVTDGVPTDCDWTGALEAAGETLKSVTTNDGSLLFFNVHITGEEQQDPSTPVLPVAYPATSAELPDTPYAKVLFTMSSVLPDAVRAALSVQLGQTVPPDTKGFIYNGSAEAVVSMFNFASIPAFAAIDPDQ